VNKIRKGDSVIVTAGRDKGRTGTVVAVHADGRVVVENVNMIKKHQRPTQKLRQGGIIEREGPIHVSNVALVDPKDGKPTRIGITVQDGERKRVTRRSGTVID